ncbi:MBOAT family O-acyltransferase [Alcaligenes endophyticus]|uniref:Probable alginate O-acetylase AlgI n=1 Tax=Alcaligenes endophyticus TaxID=1929088 RepID=A0ABT8EES6_9BURK|nr:MBOAT family O-acyltransferase [Alcaligenes endophyticus]MCX5592339.1 MBOAT family protein [Alcaligenes endophyticus]MDN4119782.1 MBOAT family protein [Alcaligenes endophyticus]
MTLLTWVGGLHLHGPYRGWTLSLLIGANTSVLFWYKYANLGFQFYASYLSWRGHLPPTWERVGLPIGLSFIVLQAISYLIDVYRGQQQAERNGWLFATYIAMFGQLIAGPILRYEWVQSALLTRTLSVQGMRLGARRFMLGFSMKVLIADTLSPLVDALFAVTQPGFFDAWLACLAYSVQLLFDFAGYSAMAIGIGLMLGFSFPENFRQPYSSRSIQEFWRRWHISLSTWIRDYLYIPLGGSRVAPWRGYANLIIVMAIGGLWHGSDSLNFLLWGLAHGVAQAVAKFWSRMGLSMPATLGHFCTLLFVFLAWVVFRSPDWSTAWTLYRAQLGLSGWQLSDTTLTVLRYWHCLALSLGLMLALLPESVVSDIKQPGTLKRIWFYGGPVLLFLLSMGFVLSRQSVPFLYFQF